MIGVLVILMGLNFDFFNMIEDFGGQVLVGNYILGNLGLSLDELECVINYIGMRQVNGCQVWVQNFVFFVLLFFVFMVQEIVQGIMYLWVCIVFDGLEICQNVFLLIVGCFMVVEFLWLLFIDILVNVVMIWYLVLVGGQMECGLVIVIVFLCGYEIFEVCVMGDMGCVFGGGEINVFEGLFLYDDIQY